MKTKARTLIFAVLMLVVQGAVTGGTPDSVIWVDFDSRTIPEPKEREVTFYDAFFNSQIAERWKRAADVPRLIRLAVGSRKPAANVNALDEVPDSSWFTNRHALRPMTREELARGPNRGDPPDFSRATIMSAKLEGVTPGLRLEDRNGESYLIKFDSKDYPELQSGAEVIATKILYAAGYNVPENYIGYIDPEDLEIGPDVELGERPFTREDLEMLLEYAARRPDGKYRVLASKILEGVPKGPFPYVGLRSDDPNDLIPHEHRRELRGLRVIAAWINHWDLKELNTLDMYVEEDGRKFLRHYLIDFGSALGGGKSPMEYYHGREYGFDSIGVLKEIFTLGFRVSADEKSTPLVHPAAGIFSANDFEPEDWKPTVRVMPFDNMTAEDAFWALRIVLSFTEAELRNIVETAEYSDPEVTDYIVETLLERRRIVARHWLRDSTALANFTVATGKEGAVLKFEDLLVKHELTEPSEYVYEIGDGPDRQRTAVSTPRIPLRLAANSPIPLRIWTVRDGASHGPVTVLVGSKPGGACGILRIDRT